MTINEKKMSSILKVYKYKPAILYYVVVVIVDISVCHILVFIYIFNCSCVTINKYRLNPDTTRMINPKLVQSTIVRRK